MNKTIRYIMEQISALYQELTDIRLQLFNVHVLGESGLQNACDRFNNIRNNANAVNTCKCLLSAIEKSSLALGEKLNNAIDQPGSSMKYESLQLICTELRMAIDALIFVLKPVGNE